MKLPVTVYVDPQQPRSREVLAWVQALEAELGLQIVTLDVTQDPALARGLDGRLPRVEAGRYRLEGDFDQRRLEVTLRAARDGHTFRQELAREQGQDLHPARLPLGERLMFYLSKHFLTGFVIFLGLYVGLPFLAPVFMKMGWTAPATVLYKVYSVTCHQLAFRSWFLFGEQPAYPRAAAGVPGLRTFGEVTGLDENDLWAARSFIGNERLGYKVAFCERDVAIWGAFFLFGLAYWVAKRFGKRIPPLKWYWWILIGWIPIGLDGFSQILSQVPGSPLPYRESTPLLRTLTGLIFGLTTAWFMVPQMDESMEESYRLLLKRLRHAARARQDAPRG